MLTAILEYSTNPLALALGIIVIAWIWEDAAVVTGALLAADGFIGLSGAVVAVFVGIASGDLALYYLGRMAHRWRKVRAWILTNRNSRSLSRKFRQRTFSNIMIIRFIPGLRTVGFTLCGLWKVPLRRFLLAMSVAGVVWISIIFTGVYRLGSSEWLKDSQFKWGLIAIALLLLVFNNVWAYRRRARKG